MAFNDEFINQLKGSWIQWIKGDNLGLIQQITDIKFFDGYDHFVFDDETKEISIKFPDWFTPIEDKHTPIIQPAYFANSKQSNDSLEISMESNVTEVSPLKGSYENKISYTEDPLMILLNKQKKIEENIELNLKLEIPKSSSLKILKESFDNFDEIFIEWLKNNESIFNVILEEIKNKLIEE